jgi:tetratricopeptide (TPR) repeat protein
MPKFLYFLALVCISTTGFNQSRLIDSLKISVWKQQDAGKRAAMLEELCFQFFSSSRQDSLIRYFPILKQEAGALDDKRLQALALFYESQSWFRTDSAKFFESSTLSIELSKKNNCSDCLALNYLGLGLKFRNLVLYNNAIESLGQGLAVMEGRTSKRILEITASTHITYSVVLHYQGKYSDGLQHALEAAKLGEQLRDPHIRQKAYNSLSAIYGELYSPDNNFGTEADRQHYKALAKFYMLKTYEGSLLVSSKKTSAVAAYNLGLFFSESNQMDSSDLFLNEAIRLGVESKYNELLSNAYNVKGGNAAKTLPDSAMLYFDKAIEFAVAADFSSNQATAMISKASLLQAKGRRNEAMKLAEQALVISQQSDVQATTLNAYKLLAELYEQNGNSTKAFEYFKKHIAVKDSLVSADNYARIEGLKARYDSELKDGEIRSLSQTSAIQALEIRQRNSTVIALVGFILLAGVGVYLLVRQRTIAQQQKQLNLENRFLRFQLNPHFLSNALVSIQRFLFETNAQQAGDYLARFSRLMRQFLEYSRKDTITIEDEIEVLRNYMDIQKLSFSNGFEYEILIDARLDVSADKIPPMFAQPFVENALEHGIKGMTNGKLLIEFKKSENFVSLMIRDNGKGISTEESKAGRISLATTIIQERMALLNRSRKEKISIGIVKPPDGQGTEVNILLPIYS